jgi:glutamine amidotransferase
VSVVRAGVVDYGMGNLRSVAKALEAAGARVTVSADRATLDGSDLLVVPGQGAFGAAATVLGSRGLAGFIKGWLSEDRPFLGICLGLQVLFEGSEEAPGVKGLGVLSGRVRKFRPKRHVLKVPHMGWNQAAPVSSAGAFAKALPEADHFYFVHSFYADPEDDSAVWTRTNYDGKFCSAVARGNLVATQFHPEKSGDAGLRLLKNILKEIRP